MKKELACIPCKLLSKDPNGKLCTKGGGALSEVIVDSENVVNFDNGEPIVKESDALTQGDNSEKKWSLISILPTIISILVISTATAIIATLYRDFKFISDESLSLYEPSFSTGRFIGIFLANLWASGFIVAFFIPACKAELKEHERKDAIFRCNLYSTIMVFWFQVLMMYGFLTDLYDAIPNIPYIIISAIAATWVISRVAKLLYAL